MIRIEMTWLALGASDLLGGIDILLGQVLRGFAGGAQAHHACVSETTVPLGCSPIRLCAT